MTGEMCVFWTDIALLLKAELNLGREATRFLRDIGSRIARSFYIPLCSVQRACTAVVGLTDAEYTSRSMIPQHDDRHSVIRKRCGSVVSLEVDQSTVIEL